MTMSCSGAWWIQSECVERRRLASRRDWTPSTATTTWTSFLMSCGKICWCSNNILVILIHSLLQVSLRCWHSVPSEARTAFEGAAADERQSFHLQSPHAAKIHAKPQTPEAFLRPHDQRWDGPGKDQQTSWRFSFWNPRLDSRRLWTVGGRSDRVSAGELGQVAHNQSKRAVGLQICDQGPTEHRQAELNLHEHNAAAEWFVGGPQADPLDVGCQKRTERVGHHRKAEEFEIPRCQPDDHRQRDLQWNHSAAAVGNSARRCFRDFSPYLRVHRKVEKFKTFDAQPRIRGLPHQADAPRRCLPWDVQCCQRAAVKSRSDEG